MENKEKVLANELEIEVDEAAKLIEDGDYLVLTDEEADEMAIEYIKDSLWAFNASFIVNYCGLDRSLEEAIQTWKQEKCEGANDGIESLIENAGSIEDFAEDAMRADGRGHFMSSYDGNEIETDEGFYIYRIN